MKGTSNPTHQYPPSMSAASRDVIGTSKPTHQRRILNLGSQDKAGELCTKQIKTYCTRNPIAKSWNLSYHGTGTDGVVTCCCWLVRDPGLSLVRDPGPRSWSEPEAGPKSWSEPEAGPNTPRKNENKYVQVRFGRFEDFNIDFDEFYVFLMLFIIFVMCLT